VRPHELLHLMWWATVTRTCKWPLSPTAMGWSLLRHFECVL
jgi:hypothetical protein